MNIAYETDVEHDNPHQAIKEKAEKNHHTQMASVNT